MNHKQSGYLITESEKGEGLLPERSICFPHFSFCPYVCLSWVSRTSTYLSVWMTVLDLGWTPDQMYLITVFPGSPVPSHLFTASVALLAASLSSLNPQPTQSTSHLTHMPSICPLLFLRLPLCAFPVSPLSISKPLIPLRPNQWRNLKELGTLRARWIQICFIFFPCPDKINFFISFNSWQSSSQTIIVALTEVDRHQKKNKKWFNKAKQRARWRLFQCQVKMLRSGLF